MTQILIPVPASESPKSSGWYLTNIGMKFYNGRWRNGEFSRYKRIDGIITWYEETNESALEQRNRELENINKVLEKTASSLMHNNNKLEQFNRELVDRLDKVVNVLIDLYHSDPKDQSKHHLNRVKAFEQIMENTTAAAPAGQKGGEDVEYTKK